MIAKPFKYRTVSFLASLTLSALLGGQAFACFFPAPMEMGEGQAMDCCARSCRMETTPMAAKQACQQSRVATSQEQVLAGSAMAAIKTAIKDVANSVLPFLHDPAFTHPVLSTLAEAVDVQFTTCRSVDRYLLTRSLRI